VEGLVVFQSAVERRIASFEAATREATHRAVSLRILIELHEQVAGFRAVSRDVTATMGEIDRHAMSSTNLADLVRAVLDSIARLPGSVSGYFARADDAGKLQIEGSFGSSRPHDVLIAAGVQAWEGGNTIVTDAWHHAEPGLTFRSSASVPIVDEGSTVALLGLASPYPGYFSTDRIARLASHVRQILGHAVAQRSSAPVIALSERDEYRRMLAAGRVTLRYQPILDLRSGGLVKVEALARLEGDAGEMISPASFLPAFGEADLLQLFAHVVHDAARDCVELERAGLLTRVAVNIPAHALGDPRYLEVLFDALAIHALPPSRLALEVLETTGGSPDAGRHRDFIARVRDAGVTIEQDDLGSGHSSLVRLDQYPFDAVKVDQELVRSALRNPQRALEFILYLTRLAHALETQVTVEGLESPGILEAAAILGADCGQGYAIAHPMQRTELAAWYESYVYPVDPGAPRTELGASAARLIAR
jgi:EAL domain-containing protein (putative c-di-GMP-specific phosphodiesterase class I)